MVWADNYRSGMVGGTDQQVAQLAGVVSTTLGQSHPSDSEVYGARIFKLTDGSLFYVGNYSGFHTWLGISPDWDTAIAVACNVYDIDIETVAET